MFIERLTKEDFELYAETWSNYHQAAYLNDKIKYTNRYDEDNHLLCVDVLFHCFDEKNGEKQVSQSLTDFSNSKCDIEFFVKRFGMEYVTALNGYLKANHYTTYRRKAIINNTLIIFYDNLFSNKSQKTLADYENSSNQPRTDKIEEANTQSKQ